MHNISLTRNALGLIVATIDGQIVMPTRIFARIFKVTNACVTFTVRKGIFTESTDYFYLEYGSADFNEYKNITNNNATGYYGFYLFTKKGADSFLLRQKHLITDRKAIKLLNDYFKGECYERDNVDY